MKNPTVVFQKRGEIEIVDFKIPEVGPGQILVEAETSLISSGTELTCLEGKFNSVGPWASWVKYPFRPGYSLIGRIAELGPGNSGFKVGDRVALPSPHARFAAANVRSAVRVPEGISIEDAAWFNLAAIAQIGIRRSQLRLGDQIAVVGLGVVGQLLIQYCRLMGARDVIAIGTNEVRLDAAKKSGATTVIRSSIQDAAGEILADVVFDATGNPDCLKHALELVRPQGKLCLIGDTGFPEKQSLSPNFIVRGIQLIAAHDSNATPFESASDPWTVTKMQQLFFLYLARQQMNVSHLTTHRFPVSKATEAYRILSGPNSPAIGVSLNFN
jgi:2-desacetyl-2-hydroxyethyl bacteriochlorophyllide A dehydrogenase